MRKVNCYDCGKRYDYDDDGFCPNCGAFNLPPKTSRIGADGDVVRLDGLNERNHANSFVHDELHEENRERRKQNLDRPAVKKPSAEWQDVGRMISTTARGKKKAPSIVWIILIFVIFVNFLLPLFGMMLF